MARRNKRYDDDDGRTIVDMSGVSHQQLFSAGDRGRESSSPFPEKDSSSGDESRPWELNAFTKEERRAFIGGALKAALLIALIFIGGLALAIALLLLLWK